MATTIVAKVEVFGTSYGTAVAILDADGELIRVVTPNSIVVPGERIAMPIAMRGNEVGRHLVMTTQAPNAGFLARVNTKAVLKYTHIDAVLVSRTLHPKKDDSHTYDLIICGKLANTDRKRHLHIPLNAVNLKLDVAKRSIPYRRIDIAKKSLNRIRILNHKPTRFVAFDFIEAVNGWWRWFGEPIPEAIAVRSDRKPRITATQLNCGGAIVANIPGLPVFTIHKQTVNKEGGGGYAHVTEYVDAPQKGHRMRIASLAKGKRIPAIFTGKVAARLGTRFNRIDGIFVERVFDHFFVHVFGEAVSGQQVWLYVPTRPSKVFSNDIRRSVYTALEVDRTNRTIIVTTRSMSGTVDYWKFDYDRHLYGERADQLRIAS